MAGNPCAGAPELEAASRELPNLGRECWPKLGCWREKIKAARALRERYPTEIVAHRVLVTTVVWASQSHRELRPIRAELKREYQVLSSEYPKNPAYPYLLGRLEENRKESRRLLEESVARDPAFPWAHERLVRALAQKPTEKQKVEARSHFEAFAKTCSARTSDILSLLSSLPDRAAWQAHAPALRAAVAREKREFDNWSALWQLEFQFTEPSEFGKLRERLRSEAAAVRRLDRRSDHQWLASLATAYQMLGDETGENWILDTRIVSLPCSQETTQGLMERQQKELGRSPEAGPERQAWLAKWMAGISPLVARCPDELFLRQVELSYLSQWDDAPAHRIVAAADKVALIPDNAASGRIAEVYLEKNMRLDRVPALLDADDQASEEQWRQTNANGLEDDDLRQMHMWHRHELFARQSRRTRLALAQLDSRGVANWLPVLASTLADIDKSSLTPGDRQALPYLQAQLWQLRGEAAALAGRNKEALENFGRSLVMNPREEKVAKLARAAYARLHQNASSFDQWRSQLEQAARTASDEVTRTVDRPLPEFRLSDLTGRTWTTTDLRGKSVLVNFWATWCGPCRSELPHIQKLHEKLKSSPNLAVVTVSLDENPGLIEPFLRREKYTFPVLVAGSSAFEEWAPGGIPQNYIVDPDVTIVREQLGFSGDGDRWINDMERHLREAAAPANPTPKE